MEGNMGELRRVFMFMKVMNFQIRIGHWKHVQKRVGKTVEEVIYKIGSFGQRSKVAAKMWKI